MERENRVLWEILNAWGAHLRLRLWRANVGVGWFANGKPARKTDPGAYPVKFGTPGQADISGIVDGGIRLEIECKSETGRLRADQMAFKHMIDRFGGWYCVVRSLSEFDQFMASKGITR